MHTFLAIIEYDGTAFSGWQKQPRGRTVQGELEAAAESIVGVGIKTVAAGRTDGGVHALAQAVALTTGKNIEVRRFLNALNARLPEDIAVTSLVTSQPGFNPRFKALQKIYQYRIWNSPICSVWHRKYSWHIINRLDLAAMRRAAAVLSGAHDFSAFDASGGSQPNKKARLEKVSIARKEATLTITLQGDRFLYKMVRNIVGTLVEVGRGRMAPESMKKILASRLRTEAGPTAPPEGLFLKKVIF